ncbi:MAG: hypothetical protein ACXW0R_08815 [Gaiellaceae bacterium]
MTTIATDEVVMSRDDLVHEIDDLSAGLGYEPGEFLQAVREGTVPDTSETSKLLVLARLAI